jgi:hypothetical protein
LGVDIDVGTGLDVDEQLNRAATEGTSSAHAM